MTERKSRASTGQHYKEQYVCPQCEGSRIRFDVVDGVESMYCPTCGYSFESFGVLETRPATVAGEIQEFIDDVRRYAGND